MSTFEVLIISAILSMLAFLGGLRTGFRIGVKVGIASAMRAVFDIHGLTTMTEADDAPASTEKRV